MRVVIYGSRPDGHARVVAEAATEAGGFDLVGLIDDFGENASRRVGALEVLGTVAHLSQLLADGVEGVLLGFGSAAGRRPALEKVRAAGIQLPQLVHRTAHLATSATVLSGAQVLANAVVGPEAVVGTGALVNTAAIVEHDVVLEEGAVVGPGAVITGRVRVHAGAAIGAGAVLLPDVEVGAGAIVGAGAVVTESVTPATSVAGVPAKRLGSGDALPR
jgi:sugar O-acyltransferase (sialic acid O-acetyltransferase NeuD family)